MVVRSVVLILFTLQIQQILSQDDFTKPIKCYKCKSLAKNGSCADPAVPESIPKKDCINGVCIKWTYYVDGLLYMERTCSAENDIDFHLTMVDGVCRTERNSNGYLCMCGKHYCNSSETVTASIVMISVSSVFTWMVLIYLNK